MIVAFANSIHTQRWVSQLCGQGWDVRVFPSLDLGLVHPEMTGVRVYHGVFGQSSGLKIKRFMQKNRWFEGLRGLWGMRLRPKLTPNYQHKQLCRVIEKFRPDIIHSLEFQASGYLTLQARHAFARDFPCWIATNWGSDIYHFRQFPEHEKKIRSLLEACDYYSCECERDVCLAKAYGFKGTVLPVMPNTGGFDLQAIAALCQPGPISSRRIVMIKGYHHWVGRALVGIEALWRCVDLLRGYEVVTYSSSQEVDEALTRFGAETGVGVRILPEGTPHRTIIEHHGRARISVGLSLSDGISTSFLEALTMGSFPIQSWTACADEWIEDGKSGLLVPPEDVDAVGAAIRKALTDDALVDRAAELNAATSRQRLDHRLLREQARDYYRRVASEQGIPCL